MATRFIVRATIPVDAGNDMVRGDMGALLQKVMGDLKAEATYFAVESGQRTVYAIVSVENSAEITRIAEPLWLALSADVELIPCMSQDDFGAAMTTIADVASRY